MATLYYLNRDQGPSQTKLRATELHTRLHTEPLDSLTTAEFETLYREMAGSEPDDLDAVRARWTRRGGADEKPVTEREERDLGIGDLVEIDGTFHLNTPTDWVELAIES